jgi:hypothetical protein
LLLSISVVLPPGFMDRHGLFLFAEYGKIAFVKAQLQTWLSEAAFHKIADAALEHGRIISMLITFTYEENPLVRWRAVDALGRCAERLCSIRPEMLKNLLRRLFWLMSDESGAVAWHAPEAIGEIVRTDPTAFADFIPMVVALLDLEPEDRPPFLPGILYALGRIGKAQPDAVKEGLAKICEALTVTDAQARAMAVWCLGQLREQTALLQHPKLEQDRCPVVIYRKEQLLPTTVGNLWAEATAASPAGK